MNQVGKIFAIVTGLFLFSGCPVAVPYPLGVKGTEKIDKALVDTWIQSDSSKEVIEMKIDRVDDYTLHITVLSKGEMYSEDVESFNAWCTMVDNKKFICLQDDTDTKASYYTYCYEVAGKMLKSYDIGLLVGGTDAVTSTDAYRKEVSASLKKEDALSSETVWSRR